MALIQEIKVPLLSVNDTSLTIVDILVTNGNKVKVGDLLMIFETSKTTYEIHSEAEGYIKILSEKDKDYDVNTVVAAIYSTKDETAIILNPDLVDILQHKSDGFNKDNSNIETNQFSGSARFSESALQLMDELKADTSLFEGWDLVSKEDVEVVILKKRKEKKSTFLTKSITNETKEKLPENVYSQDLTSNKKREIEYLSAVQGTGLISTVYINIDTTNIFGFINPQMKFLKNSLLPVTIYECSKLLQKYKILNGFFDDNKVYYYNEINAGFAIDIDNGLKVVKIKSSDQINLQELEEQIFSLSEKYLENKLSVEDLTGITFTITDLSGEGINFFKPLVNKYNSAILGISSTDSKTKNQVLSLTFDHRVTEGKLASAFLKELKQRLESYASKDINNTRPDISCYKCFKTLEEDLSGIGFVTCITSQGRDGYICSSCWNGH